MSNNQTVIGVFTKYRSRCGYDICDNYDHREVYMKKLEVHSRQ